jgi:hypothetical protein
MFASLVKKFSCRGEKSQATQLIQPLHMGKMKKTDILAEALGHRQKFTVKYFIAKNIF